MAVTRSAPGTLLATIALAAIGACASTSHSPGEGWTRVDFEPTEFYGLYIVIDVTDDQVRFNGVALNGAEVLNEIRKIVPLIPRPAVFLRFSDREYATAHRLGRAIRDAGACDDGGCMYRVSARPAPSSGSPNKAMDRTGGQSASPKVGEDR
jgi:hypothetical protein